MTRVIAGQAGGRRLIVPKSETRPTSDRAREGLFGSVISMAGPLDGMRVLDLYAGSGAVGLEALSRGASHVTLVEHAAPAVRAIRANVAVVGLPGATVIADRVERFLAGAPVQRYDLVFADPPYMVPLADLTPVLITLASGWLVPDAVVVVERATRDPDLTWPDGYVLDRARRYGEATFWYGRAQS